jgi:uncharacterized membrane protein YoaK (UPF0700 family)
MKSWFKLLRSSWLLPAVLSTTAGAVDVIGFLALGGLFTAHITGNVCIAAAHYVTGGFSQVGPILAVPVFMVVLGVLTLVFGPMARAGSCPLRPMLSLQAALLAGFLGLGVAYGPFPNSESLVAVVAGMLGVAAMATQNALVKLALKGAPSTAVMTTNITQLATDLATLARRRGDSDELAEARRRANMIIPVVVGFVVGCAAGAYLEVHFALWALALPVFLAALAIVISSISA